MEKKVQTLANNIICLWGIFLKRIFYFHEKNLNKYFASSSKKILKTKFKLKIVR